MVPKKLRVGKTQAALAERQRLFVERYLVNGHNATDAAVHAGYSPKDARQRARRLMRTAAIKALLAARAEVAAEAAAMTTENWARELRSIAFADPADLLDDDGKVLALEKMPRHIRAALQSVKVKAVEKGATVTEIKFWSKTDALTTMARHLGLFEKDNAQTAPNLSLVVKLV